MAEAIQARKRGTLKHLRLSHLLEKLEKAHAAFEGTVEQATLVNAVSEPPKAGQVHRDRGQSQGTQ